MPMSDSLDDAPVATATVRATRQETNVHRVRINNNLNQLARDGDSNGEPEDQLDADDGDDGVSGP